MATIVYVLKDGRERRIDVPEGTSVMVAAIQNNIPGLEAECGGGCSCATCHVYIDPAHAARLAAPDDGESAMLEGVAAERRPTSRLSCQITVSDALDGLVIHIPDRQTL